MAEWRISETQKGSIAENLICNWLIIGSGGRLSPYQPVADDAGVDLLVYDRDTQRTLLLQIKGRTRTEATTAKKRGVRFNLRTATFEERPNFYIAGVLLDATLQMPEALWLIPSAVVERNAIHSRKDEDGNSTRLAVCCSASCTSGDKWCQYRAHSIKDFVTLVYQALS